MEASAEETPQKGDTGPDETGSGSSPPKQVRWDARRSLLRMGLALLVFFAGTALLSKLFGPTIESLGRAFIERFGLVGIGFGMFWADTLSMPPPPVFYIVMVAAAPGPHLPGMAVIGLGSMAAGFTGSRLARLLAARPFFRKRIDATRATMDVLFERYGVWGFAIATITPIPYSFLCYVAGIYRVRGPLMAFVILLRVPRLFLLYWLLRAGWVTGGG